MQSATRRWDPAAFSELIRDRRHLDYHLPMNRA
jgi:hypothetical protein